MQQRRRRSYKTKQGNNRGGKLNRQVIDSVIPRNANGAVNQTNTLKPTTWLGEESAKNQDPTPSAVANTANSHENRYDDRSYLKHRKDKDPLGRTLFGKLVKLALVVGVFGVVFFVGKSVYNTFSVFSGGGEGSAVLRSGDKVNPLALKAEGDSRVNILLMGVGGVNHDGGDLSDTNVIVSVDPINKTAGMFSLPRDLFLEIPGFYSARINEANRLGELNDYEGGGPGLLEETIEQVLNIPVHYYIRVDLHGFEAAVDAVGGIELYVEDKLVDPIYSYEELGYAPPFTVEEGWQEFDGKRALFYARSRQTSPRGDFDRNDRQREILIAIKDKALSLGTFSNPKRILDLTSALSKNISTNISVGEINSLYRIAEDVGSSEIESLGVATDNVLVNANIGGAAVVVPENNNYSLITKYFFDSLPDGFLQKESPTVSVYNATGIAGKATATADVLTALGYEVVDIDNYEDSANGNAVCNNADVDKPFTQQYLRKRFEVEKINNNCKLYSSINTQAEYIIILGEEDTNN